MRAPLLTLLFGLWTSVVFAQPAYTVKTLEQIATFPQSSVVAQVVANNESRIASELTARIAEIPVRVGQSVRKGDLLAKLDAREFRLALEQAESQVELLRNRQKLAQLQFEQTKSLQASNFVSAQALEQRRTELAVVESELKIARNNVNQARLALAKTSLRAPFAGAVKERLAGEGELAAPGQPVITLVEQGNNELRAQVSSREIRALQTAKSVTFRQAGNTYPAKIVRISPVIDAQAQTREVILSTDKPLLSGSAGELVWASPTPHLPPAYIQERDGKTGAWIEKDGKPVFHPLPAAQVGRPVPVELPPQTRIIDEGRFALALPANRK
jgi:RND family efflux transporter MFP subunit